MAMANVKCSMGNDKWAGRNPALDFGFDRGGGNLYKKKSTGQEGVGDTENSAGEQGILKGWMNKERGKQWLLKKRCKSWQMQK